MKKFSLIMVLALVLISAFAVVAFADPDHPNNAGDPASGAVSNGTPDSVYWDGQAIHTNYKANTDACASCHAVHTGNGIDLLQWDTSVAAGGVSNVCVSCHDGTITSTYDVITGHVGSTGALSNAGLFAVQNAGAGSASEHSVFSGLQLNAAYGGATSPVADQYGVWSADFDCVSCHTPHGQGGSVRILDPNPNWVMTAGQDPSSKKGVNNALLGTGDGTTTKFYFSAVTLNGANTTNALGTVLTTLPGTKPVLGRPYTPNVYKNFVKQTQGNPTLNYAATATCIVSFDPGTTNAYVEFYTAPAAGVVLTVDYTVAIQVNATVANKLTSIETVTYNTTNSGINNFCGACHTDYNTSSSAVRALSPWADVVTANSAGFNVYSQKSRHGVGNESIKNTQLQPSDAGKLTCITCHFAHGVDQTRWAALDTKFPGNGYSVYNIAETAGTSKLKRLPNMGVCEVCHQKEVGAYSPNNIIKW